MASDVGLNRKLVNPRTAQPRLMKYRSPTLYHKQGDATGLMHAIGTNCHSNHYSFVTNCLLQINPVQVSVRLYRVAPQNGTIFCTP